MQSLGAASLTSGPNSFQNAEVLLCATPAYSVPKDSVLVLVLASLYFQFGTGITEVTLTLRRGGVGTGQVLGNPFVQTVTPSTYFPTTVACIDTLISGGQAQWSLTATGTGATGNSFAINMTMVAIFLQ